MNVFVLSPGRSGSKTFALACMHLDNFTSGHETRAKLFGPQRFNFPDQHIEVDNRLTWFLGTLGKLYDSKDVLYVHLIRDPEKVSQSMNKRWKLPNRSNIMRSFAHGIVMRNEDYDEKSKLKAAEYYVQTVNNNIEEFIKHRPSMTVNLLDNGKTFDEFLNRINAVGDIEKVKNVWNKVHNES